MKPLAKKALDALRGLALKEQGASPPKSDPQGSLPFIPEEGKVLTIQTPRQPQGKPRARMAPVKIYSRLFNEEIWLVADQEEMEALVSKGVKEVIYMAWEIPVLKGVDKERLRALHLTKKVFPGSARA